MNINQEFLKRLAAENARNAQLRATARRADRIAAGEVKPRRHKWDGMGHKRDDRS